MDDVAVHVCEAALDAVVIEGEFFVVDAQQVKCSGMEVIGISGLVGSFPPQFVSGSGRWRLDRMGYVPFMAL